jgi:hypothetical protein
MHLYQHKFYLKNKHLQRKVSDIPSRSSENNSFQKRKTEIITKINLIKELFISNNNDPVLFFITYVSNQ